jgi:hypothetical protein
MSHARNTKVIRIAGAFLIVIGVFLLVIAYQGLRFFNYQQSGITARATVADKYTAQTRKVAADSSLHRSDYLLDVTFFTSEQTAGGKFITAKARADGKSVAALHKGDRVQITYLPGDPQNSVVLKDAFEAATLGLDKSRLESYRQIGIAVEATVDEIDSDQHTLSVMFVTSLSSRIADFVSATLDVSKSAWDSVNKGESIEVVYLPQDPKNNVVAQRALEEGAVSPYLMSALALVAFASGVGLMWRYGRPTQGT